MASLLVLYALTAATFGLNELGISWRFSTLYIVFLVAMGLAFLVEQLTQPFTWLNLIKSYLFFFCTFCCFVFLYFSHDFYRYRLDAQHKLIQRFDSSTYDCYTDLHFTRPLAGVFAKTYAIDSQIGCESISLNAVKVQKIDAKKAKLLLSFTNYSGRDTLVVYTHHFIEAKAKK